MSYVNIPSYCEDCTHLRRLGSIMVGTYSTGGPEPSYDCCKGRSMTYYWYNGNDERCPDYDDGEGWYEEW